VRGWCNQTLWVFGILSLYMARYFSTFIPGLGEVVQAELKRKLPDLKVELLVDGLVVYETEASIEEVSALRFLNNSFYVFHFFKKVEPNSLVGMMKFVYNSDFLKKMSVPRVKSRDRSFRVITSYQNKLRAVELNVLKNAEEKIAKATRLTLDRSKPDLEFWFLERSEGIGFFALRLTYDRRSEKDLERGELRPELCNLLCILSEPQEDDVFLDPFSGTGAILRERMQIAYSKLFVGEKDKDKFECLKTRFHKNDVEVFQADATKLPLGDDSVNKIVTDPPWGQAEEVEAETLYKGMFAEFSRVLRRGGVLVLLTSQKDIVEEFLKESSDFSLDARYDVLVSGRKAGVFKIRRI